MRHNDLAILDDLTLPELEIRLDLHTRELIPVTKYTAFSWSNSRHGMLQRCRRQYYLNYYGSRRVRESREPVVSAIWWLKQATSLPAWIGSVVHETAKTAVTTLQQGGTPDAAELVENAKQMYRGGLQASRRGAKFGNQWVILQEHLQPDSDDLFAEAEGEFRISQLVEDLLASEVFDWLRGLPRGSIREVDPSFRSFTLPDVPPLGDVRVFAIPDVLVLDGDELHIVDWKTGDVTREGIRTQAGVYRLFAHHEYGMPEEAIHFRLVDLAGGGVEVGLAGDAPSLAEADAFVRASINHMVAGMEHPRYNTAAIRYYPRTDETALCRHCPFQRACWRHEDADD